MQEAQSTAPREEPLADLKMVDMLQVLGDPIRLQIVTGLAERGEAGCSQLGLPVSKSTVTHHFQVLRDAGVIASRNVGTARISHLRREEMERYFPGLLEAILTPDCR